MRRAMVRGAFATRWQTLNGNLPSYFRATANLINDKCALGTMLIFDIAVLVLPILEMVPVIKSVRGSVGAFVQTDSIVSPSGNILSMSKALGRSASLR